MKPSFHPLRAALMAAALSIAAVPASAQQGDADVLRQAQLQLRQSEQERSTLRAEVSRLEQALADRTRQLEQLQAALEDKGQAAQACSSNLAATAGRRRAAESALAESQESLDALRAAAQRDRIAAENLRVMYGNSQQRIALQDELMDLCRSRNTELYAIGSGLARQYDAVMGGGEPVFQMKRVRMENLMQDLEDRLRAQRVYEDTLPPSLEQQMQKSLDGPVPARGDASQ